jgi:hypothetical protein
MFISSQTSVVAPALVPDAGPSAASLPSGSSQIFGGIFGLPTQPMPSFQYGYGTQRRVTGSGLS